MNNSKQIPGVVFLGLLAVSCSGSSDSPADIDTPSVGNELEDRLIVTSLMQIIDLTDYVASTLTPSVSTVPAGTAECTGGGSTERVDAEDEQRVSYTNCKLSTDAAITLNGDVTVKRDSAGGRVDMSYSQLTLEDSTQEIVLNGGLRVSYVEVARIAASSSLTVTRGTNSIAMSEFEFTRLPDGIGAEATGYRVSVSFKATMTDPDVSLAITTTESMASDEVSCPTSGGIAVVVDADRTIEISGGQGGNLIFTVGDDVQTLACSEIDQID